MEGEEEGEEEEEEEGEGEGEGVDCSSRRNHTSSPEIACSLVSLLVG